MSTAFKVNLSQQSAAGSMHSKRKSMAQASDLLASGEAKQTFADLVSEGLKAVNDSQVEADKMTTNLSTGRSENIHETMLAVSNAELSFKMMVQIRNKALEAYQEIMRMQV